MTIFGPDFGALQLHDVAAFLAEADDESLLWEAKGGEGRPNAGAVRKAVCGFANSRGGYLILGTDRAGGAWTITGHDFGGDQQHGSTRSSATACRRSPCTQFVRSTLRTVEPLL